MPVHAAHQSWYASAMAFLNGPDYYVATGDTLEREPRQQPQQTAEYGVPTAQIVLSARSTADLHGETAVNKQTSVKVQGKPAVSRRFGISVDARHQAITPFTEPLSCTTRDLHSHPGFLLAGAM